MPEKGDAIVLEQDKELGGQEYRLKTVDKGGRRIINITGGSAVAVLYGAYEFAEKLGVRFQLDCDIVPDKKIKLHLGEFDENHSPLFETRGINPFHDFFEGPDWWSRDDYLVYITHLARMRMNFIGFHCYPEGNVGPEPLVWIGLDGGFDPETGEVKASYPSRWAATMGDGDAWGYADTPSSKLCAGISQLFETDMYGQKIMGGVAFNKQTPEDSNGVFNRTAELLKAAFTRAKQLGVKTCIGTETPLHLPKAVEQRIMSAGCDPSDPKVRQGVYKAMFQRIETSHPLDYYWLWTPEGWTWGGNKPEQYKATVNDINAALGALKALGDPFTLATCGWVLGPNHDRAALDNELPKSSPMSCINRKVGHDPVEQGFARVTGRPKWAIPWMENDPNMVGPQPWVGRMRADAADAKKYGCTGLLGIHWRTRVVSMNVVALAQAGWEQPWAGIEKEIPPEVSFGAQDGKTASFDAPVDNTEQDTIYQTVRYDVSSYRLAIPKGTYTVTLKFNEPHYGESGKRRFGAKVQGKTVVEKLDMVAKAGKNHAIDIAAEKVRVPNGVLNIEFVHDIELPCIAGMEIVGTQDAVNQFKARPYARRINCGGGAWQEFEADAVSKAAGAGGRTAPVKGFYLDWCEARFGKNVAEEAARIFADIDGVAFPEISGWKNGPGGISHEGGSWENESQRFAFVDKLAALRDKVKGAGNLERFDYWLHTFEYSRAIKEYGSACSELQRLKEAIGKAEDDAAKRERAKEALAARIKVVRTWEKAITHQIAAVQTPGEMGTLANLETHNRLTRWTGTDEELEKILEEPLGKEAVLSMAYGGPDRIIVPTRRTIVAEGEELSIKAILLFKEGVKDAVIRYRPMGGEEWNELPLKHVARAVYRCKMPAAACDIEYYIKADAKGGGSFVWPVTAPALNHTVAMMER